jgi:AcrR family transcriptional regulator
MELRDRVLREARRLTLERGVIPSLNLVAEAAGVSKGGVTHHFPTRAALVDGLARQALDEIDVALAAAAEAGAVVSAWLRLSVPADDEVKLFRAMAVAHRALEAQSAATIAVATEALDRCERLIAHEVGDSVQAHIIRLVGDGLAMNAFAGLGSPSLDELARLEVHLVPPGRTAHR